MSDFYSYEPKNGHGLPHDPFNAIVGPRPIGWISSQNKLGLSNIAPYSFFNAFNYVPPIIGFSSVGRKDTLNNVEETGEFVWNLVTFDLINEMNQSCVAYPPQVSEFDATGLEQAPSTLVKPARVARARVAFECKCTEIIQLKRISGEQVQTWLVLGEVIQIHIAQSLLKNGIYETAEANHVLRAGGPADYFKIGRDQLFKLPRPA